MSRRHLGRGLAALIPDEVLPPSPSSSPLGGAAGGGAMRIPLSMVHPNPEQPRRTFDPVALAELADSIREHGVLSPLLVLRAEGGGVQLIAGERRLRAAGLAGLAEVPVLVQEEMTPELQLEVALVENLQRQDLDPIEEARGYSRLQLDYGYTQERIAHRVGKERSTVANLLRLLRLPPKVLELVSAGRLSTGHAKALLGVEDDDTLKAIVGQVLARELSVRATEQLVRSQTSVRRATVSKQRSDRAVKAVSELLTRELQTGVDLKPRARGEGGKIVIDYYSAEELERLIKVLRSGVER